MADSWEVFAHKQQKHFLEVIKSLRTAKNTDFVLKCGNSAQEVRAHKFILITQSRFFDTMFRSSFKESAEEFVELKTIEKNEMDKVLDFIYLNEDAKITFKNLEEVVRLLKASHFLQIDNLYKFCFLRVKEMVTIADFPYIGLLKEFQDSAAEEIVEEFVYENWSQIFDEKVHLRYDYDLMKILISELSLKQIAPTDEKIIRAIVDWVKEDKEERQQHVLELFSMTDVNDLPEPYVRSIIEEDFIVTTPEIQDLLKQHPAIPEHAQLKTSRRNYEESKLLKSLDIFSFRLIDDDPFHHDQQLCVRSSFLKPVEDDNTIERLPFKIFTDTKCLSHSNYLFLITGGNQNNPQNRFNSFVCYVPLSSVHQTNYFEFFQNPITAVVAADDRMFIVEEYSIKENEHLKTYIHHRKISLISGVLEKGYLISDKKFLSPVWLGGDHLLVLLNRIDDQRMQALIITNPEEQLIEGKLCHPQKREFRPQNDNAFKQSNTVMFGNKIYSFCGIEMHVYDPETNCVQCKISNITVGDDDSVYSLHEYKERFYVVIRQTHSNTEYSYKLWKVGSARFAGETIATKNSMLEVVALTNFKT